MPVPAVTLSLLERERIAVLRQQGLGVNEIARRLARTPSTISRELRRTEHAAPCQGAHHAGMAHARSREQARRTRVGVFARDEQLKQLVQEKLKVQWSPEQIAGWLRAEHPDRPEWHVCHETIYQGITSAASAVCNGIWRETCARAGDFDCAAARRRAAGRGSPRDSRMIDERRAVVEERSRPGDFEGDLIVGRHGLSAIGTLVDRATRLIRLVHLPDRPARRSHRGRDHCRGLGSTDAGPPDTHLGSGK